MTPCILVETCHCFGGICVHPLGGTEDGDKAFFQTVGIYRTTQRHSSTRQWSSSSMAVI